MNYELRTVIQVGLSSKTVPFQRAVSETGYNHYVNHLVIFGYNQSLLSLPQNTVKFTSLYLYFI